MATDLSKEIVLITGASRGLGAAIARAFSAQGAKIVVNYCTSEAAASSLATELKNAVAIRCDVTDKSQVKSLFAKALDHFGQPISVVVNNALVGNFKFNGNARPHINDIDWQAFDSQIQGAVRGALNTTQCALAGFEKLGYGRIINIGSNLVSNPVVPYQDYTTAKGALLAFTRTSAAELGPNNITVNMVSGGLLRLTDASESTPNEVFDLIAQSTPLRKVTTPEDVAGAVVFFASGLAKGVTGQNLNVDGGLVMV